MDNSTTVFSGPYSSEIHTPDPLNKKFEYQFINEDGQAYRPFTDPDRIRANDAKKQSGIDSRAQVRGIPVEFMHVMNFDTHDNSASSSQPKLGTKKDRKSRKRDSESALDFESSTWATYNLEGTTFSSDNGYLLLNSDQLDVTLQQISDEDTTIQYVTSDDNQYERTNFYETPKLEIKEEESSLFLTHSSSTGGLANTNVISDMDASFCGLPSMKILKEYQSGLHCRIMSEPDSPSSDISSENWSPITSDFNLPSPGYNFQNSGFFDYQQCYNEEPFYKSSSELQCPSFYIYNENDYLTYPIDETSFSSLRGALSNPGQSGLYTELECYSSPVGTVNPRLL